MEFVSIVFKLSDRSLAKVLTVVDLIAYGIASTVGVSHQLVKDTYFALLDLADSPIFSLESMSPLVLPPEGVKVRLERVLQSHYHIWVLD